MVRQAGDVPNYTLEVIGPILPSTISGLVQLFDNTQHSFTSAYNVHEPTTPFNGVPAPEQDASQQRIPETLFNSGVDKNHLLNAARATSLGKQAIRELSSENGLYLWS